MKKQSLHPLNDQRFTNELFPCEECVTFAICNAHFFNKMDKVKKNRQMTLILELMNKCSIFKEALIETLSMELENLNYIKKRKKR